MRFRTLVIGFFSFLLVAAAVATYSGDCIRQLFSSSAEALGGGDSIAPHPSVHKDLSSFGVARGNFGGSPTTPAAETGQLTAGDWDDNLNYDYFLSFSQRFHGAHPGYAALDLEGRTILTVRDELGQPVGGARVLVHSLDGDRVQRSTAADGRVQLFRGLDHFGADPELIVTPPGGDGSMSVRLWMPRHGGEVSVALPGVRGGHPAELDLAFALDTTGSMRDELAYLKSELERISVSVRRAFPDVKVRYALVAYRDRGDEYVTRTVDFSELPAFRERLAQFSADGGGDEPESMDRAVAAMADLSWHPQSAKVAFLITDAPAHPEGAQQFLSGVDAARRRGIRIYSVAASGAGDEAEFLLRSASQLTLGRYLFLTDDSGVGNSHAEPHIPCYRVLRLSALMAVVLKSELTGRREEPAPQDVLRVVGTPVRGTCRAEVAARAPNHRLWPQ